MTDLLVHRVLDEARAVFGGASRPEITSRRDIACPYSTVSRLELQCGSDLRVVYVKRLKAANVPRDVAQRRILTEYQTLARLHSHSTRNGQLGVARPVAMFPEDLAIVTEEVPGTALMDLIGRLAKRHMLGSRVAFLAEYCRSAGEWLREFQALHVKDLRALDAGPLIRYCEQRLDMMIESGAPGIDARLKARFAVFLETRCKDVGAVRIVGCHNDYSPHNMIVDGPRLSVIDFAFFDYDWDAFDACRFWSHLEFMKASPFFSSSAIEQLQEAFFDGYGWEVRKSSVFDLAVSRYYLTRAATIAGESMRSGVRGWVDRRSYWQCLRWLAKRCSIEGQREGSSRTQAAVQEAT